MWYVVILIIRWFLFNVCLTNPTTALTSMARRLIMKLIKKSVFLHFSSLLIATLLTAWMSSSVNVVEYQGLNGIQQVNAVFDVALGDPRTAEWTGIAVAYYGLEIILSLYCRKTGPLNRLEWSVVCIPWYQRDIFHLLGLFLSCNRKFLDPKIPCLSITRWKSLWFQIIDTTA